MKDFSKATPRPWTIRHFKLDDIDAGFFVLTEDTSLYPTEQRLADAELIVTAVNNFDKMKEVIGNALANQEQYGYLTDQTQNEIKQLLESLK